MPTSFKAESASAMPRADRPGIVRPARRPTGWAPGGPAPLGPQGDAALEPGLGEDLCFLSGEFRIFQRQDGHRWSLDDLVTASLAARLQPQPMNFLDLGCGIGSVLMMLAWRFPSAAGAGIEAQDLSAALARRSLRYNGLENRISYHHGDFRHIGSVLKGTRFALITGTPPYFLASEAVESQKPQCGPCRFEWRGGVEDYCQAAAQHLHPEGIFVMVAAAPQTARVDTAAAGVGLHKIFEWVVVPRVGKAPLIAVHAFANAPGSSVRETLTVRDERGQWTEAFCQVREAMGMPTRLSRRS